MNVIVVDDERLILMGETLMVKKVLPGANVSSFREGSEALEYARANQIDIAFLDINLGNANGLELTRKLQLLNPRVNIIYCTGFSEYALDAFALHSCDYLMKPLTEAKVQNALSYLRYPVAEEKKVIVQCFGNFEVFMGGQPVRFRYIRTKELFAYLIDRRGVVSTKEIMAALFEEDTKGSYFRNLKVDLIGTFEALGMEEFIVQERGRLGIRRDLVECDYYEYLDGRTELFHGEYMSQYSFAEETLAHLQKSGS